MKKIIILIPVYNDWESLNKLLSEINENIKSFNENNFECLIVNDASTVQPPELKKPSNFWSLELLNMKENRGHARCNAFGIRYVYQKKEFDNLIKNSNKQFLFRNIKVENQNKIYLEVIYGRENIINKYLKEINFYNKKLQKNKFVRNLLGLNLKIRKNKYY